jgi:UDP-N-acetylmuramate dehydrogenase
MILPSEIFTDYPLLNKTTWKIGGNAEYFAIANTYRELITLLEWVKTKHIPLTILGNGSNVLIDDNGIPGLTISLLGDFQKISVENDIMRIGAGCKLPSVAKKASDLGYSGFEFLIGIPGTVGGGVVINAGKGSEPQQAVQSVLNSVKYITPEMMILEEQSEMLNFGYRFSKFTNSKAIVLEATFHLSKEDEPGFIRKRMDEILRVRHNKFPMQQPNAGSIFKSPTGSMSPGWLIEKAGLKGLKVGDAKISEIHANFIVNMGRAKSSEVLELMDIVLNKVEEFHGITLEKEIIVLPNESNWK